MIGLSWPCICGWISGSQLVREDPGWARLACSAPHGTSCSRSACVGFLLWAELQERKQKWAFKGQDKSQGQFGYKGKNYKVMVHRAEKAQVGLKNRSHFFLYQCNTYCMLYLLNWIIDSYLHPESISSSIPPCLQQAVFFLPRIC